jgi:hypothetical protein
MKTFRMTGMAVLALGAALLAGCAMSPGGISASNVPIEGREYINLGRTSNSSSRVYLFSVLPVSSANTIRSAMDGAIRSRRGDAMVNITVESFSQNWILFSRYVTRVEGDVIRFQ